MTGTEEPAPAWTGADVAAPEPNRSEMHCEDLMSPDLLSEIVLLGFGTLILASLVLFVVTVLARA
jgi:hypothetical protein